MSFTNITAKTISETEAGFDERIASLSGEPDLQAAVLLQRALVRPWLQWVVQFQKDQEILVEGLVNVAAEMFAQVAHNIGMPEEDAKKLVQEMGRIAGEHAKVYLKRDKPHIAVRIKTGVN